MAPTTIPSDVGKIPFTDTLPVAEAMNGLEMLTPDPWKTYNGSAHDQRDMFRLGRKQELQRNFRFLTMVAFLMVLMATWESALLVAGYGLLNGGTAGMIWLFVISYLCVLCVVASIAEMASMAPTAGGQYHWTSEFSPPSMQRPLSYLVGWCCSLGWITGIPACAQLTVGLIQGLVLLADRNANITTLWQTTLLMMTFICIAVLYNVFLPRTLPVLEAVTLVIHFAGFFVVLAVLWAKTTPTPAVEVFGQFSDSMGWGNLGVSTLVGFVVPLWSFIGPDAGAHMSEETREASQDLPRAMIWSTALNGLMGVISLITFCFCVGDVNSVLDSATGYPIIQMFYNATNSLVATAILTLILIIVSLIGAITVAAATSRQMWAFARDRGFPYSTFLAKIHPGFDVPVNALSVSLVVALLLSALNFGSTTALSAILSISNAALVFSYICSIGCLRLKRWRGEPLLARRWSLGRWGGLCNDIALAFLLTGFVFSFFPEGPKPGPADMNWAVLIFCFVVGASMTDYWFRGRYQYIGPVALVKRDL